MRNLCLTTLAKLASLPVPADSDLATLSSDATLTDSWARWVETHAANPGDHLPRRHWRRARAAWLVVVLLLTGGVTAWATSDRWAGRNEIVTVVRTDSTLCTADDPNVGVVRVDSLGQDTFVGDTYVKAGGSDEPTLAFGGWGDHYYDYLKFDARQVRVPFARAVLCLYVLTPPPNDPDLVVGRVSTPWEAAGVTIYTRPDAEDIGDFGPVTAGWNAVDVSPLLRAWMRDTSTNHGIALTPRRNIETNGEFASGRDSSVARRPRIVVEYPVGR
jgi:hypothetical protein